MPACPPHVSGLIPKVIINSVYGFAFRSGTNMVEKFHKVFSPLLAYLNPTPAIIFIVGKIRVMAPLDYAFPNTVGGISRLPVSHKHLLAVAAARFDLAVHNMIILELFNRPAITPAKAVGWASFNLNIGDNSELVKFLAY